MKIYKINMAKFKKGYTSKLLNLKSSGINII